MVLHVPKLVDLLDPTRHASTLYNYEIFASELIPYNNLFKEFRMIEALKPVFVHSAFVCKLPDDIHSTGRQLCTD